MMLQVNHLQIKGGPSREDIFDALRLQERKGFGANFLLAGKFESTLTYRGRVEVPHVIANIIPAFIVGIEAKDRTGENWILKLKVLKSELSIHRRFPPHVVEKLFGEKTFAFLKADYSTDKRKGLIVLE